MRDCQPQPSSKPTSPTPDRSPRRWLLFVHQLPSQPSKLRVRTWRRLQQLGAVAIKQAVYVLPDSPGAREDFEWLKAEIDGAGGEASVFAADSVGGWSDDELVNAFRQSRQEAYAILAREIEQVLRRAGGRRGIRAPTAHRRLEGFRGRLGAIEAVDFYGSAGRDRARTLLGQLETRFAPAGHRPPAQPQAADATTELYRSRLWVTRPRPGVDRMSSAWLIKRFIDSEARFGFVPDRESVPRDSVPFDMFGVQFSHHGAHCTFETLCAVFSIQEPAVGRLAGIVHDLDLKEALFGAPEAPTVGVLIEGLQAVHADDDALLAQGMTLFEALFRAFEQSARRVGPRPVVRPRTRGRTVKR